MCGRFTLYTDPMTLARRFKAEAQSGLAPRYNVAPSQNIPVVRQEKEGRRFAWPAGAWSRPGPRTSISATAPSTPERKRSRASRPSAPSSGTAIA